MHERDEDSIWTPLASSSNLLSLELRPFDENQRNTQKYEPLSTTENAEVTGTAIPSRIKQSLSNIALITGNVAFIIFVSYYVYESLVRSNPALGPLFFTPSTTVFVVNIMSQIVAIILKALFGSAFEALRWQLASRANGVLVTTFLTLSRATSSLGVFTLLLTARRGGHTPWGFQR